MKKTLLFLLLIFAPMMALSAESDDSVTAIHDRRLKNLEDLLKAYNEQQDKIKKIEKSGGDKAEIQAACHWAKAFRGEIKVILKREVIIPKKLYDDNFELLREIEDEKESQITFEKVIEMPEKEEDFHSDIQSSPDVVRRMNQKKNICIIS